MNQPTKCLVYTLLLGSYGCATALTDRGSQVKLSSSDPARNCQSLGPVNLGSSPSMERAQTQMINEAAGRGANYIHAVGFNYTAYYCPTSSAMTKVAH